jgi:hypothetical protein
MTFRADSALLAYEIALNKAVYASLQVRSPIGWGTISASKIFTIWLAQRRAKSEGESVTDPTD